MNFDWDHIRIFLAVARSGQILAAAKVLKLDHATVSRRLNAFEGQLQARLFERSPAGCLLTPAGEKLMAMAERVEAGILHIESAVSASDMALSGTIRIGAADGFGTYFLAPQMRSLTAAHPDLRLKLLPLPRNFSVSKREVDIAVTLEPPQDGRLICQRLVDYQLNLFVSESYPKRDARFGNLNDLRRHVVVTPILEYVYPTTEFFHEIAEYALTTYECASVSAQLEAVLAGAGVGVLPNYLALRHPELRLVLPEFTHHRTYWLVSHPDGRDVARVAAARRLIVEMVKKHRDLFSWSVPSDLTAQA